MSEPTNLSDTMTDTVLPENISHSPILNHNIPKYSAEKCLEYYYVEGMRSIHYVKEIDQFFVFKNGNYHLYGDIDMRKLILDFLNVSKCLKSGSEIETVPYIASTPKITEILNFLKILASYSVNTDPRIKQSWLFGNEKDFSNPKMAIRMNKSIFLGDVFIETKDLSNALIENTSRLFSTIRLDFDISHYDYKRLLPIRWITFLDEVFGQDEGSILLLQEWFGYCLLPGFVKFQKSLLLCGPSRSGKSIISRILQSIMGEEHCCSPSISSFNNPHTSEMLIGKSLCSIEDARYGREREAFRDAFLNITGQDPILINPKNKRPFTAILNCKVMMVTNALPNISDDGKAFANRLMVIKTINSFLGKEDFDLFEKLKEERPRIFLWALDGLLRLIENNRFTEPESMRSIKEFVGKQQSPVLDFVECCCNLGKELSIPKATLYNAYVAWCNEEGIDALNTVHFARLIMSNYNISPSRPRDGSDRIQMYSGVSLKDRS